MAKGVLVKPYARGAIVLLILIALLASAWPMPVQAFHAQLEGPGPGTMLQGWTSAGHGNLTFTGIEQRLVAHHEWRDVVVSTIEFPSLPEPQPFGPAFDVETGLFVGRSFDYSIDVPIYGEALGELGFGHRFEATTLGGYLGLDALLPESLLWGRYLWPGDSWDVSAVPWAADATEVNVRVEAGATISDLVVHVSQRHTRNDVTSELLWRLTLGPEDSVVASERVLAYRPDVSAPDDVVYSEFPLALLQEAAEPFQFGGASHVALTNGQDLLMTYGAVGALPEDPDPHPLFDIHEAFAAAMTSDHEAVRAFHSRAIDLYVVYASLSGVDALDRSVRWRIELMEAGGNHLVVRLDGFKTPWTPLVVTDVEGDLSAGHEHYLDPSGRNATVTVHPGSYARYFDGFAGERDRVVIGYEWSLESFWAGGFATAGGQARRSQDLSLHECPLRVEVDGASGVVISSGTHGSSRLPDASCRHELWYEELEPVEQLV